ncbi:glutamine-hydrolyzing carbamoyl-phosphate synthase small subunit [Candidatus Vallotia lariciata]|uniref:glutamine-hydrolyzing carbamoyl-phosphate synthase small subunit n=1 Tax=Candidatus Vallotia laricis TaxID=2018052 RepID=UPI001D01D634|nr:glutamine-hydrolyzing carbamoyl-phosphate synthase small subunit [Candidatus Vallotia lariciata]UDG83166.1 Carbamoyl-phosphate synthase small chain [Candidatus Vallotia lariciata]
MLPSFTPALLALADGTILRGYSIGAIGNTIGEIVFNTAITGYQEIITDPSYARQIITMTYPHIGNVGVNGEDIESDRIHAAGLVIRDLPVLTSNFRSQCTLSDYLSGEGIVAIAGLDTRRLTRILRECGTQNGCILVGTDEQRAVNFARSFEGLAGIDLAKVVSTNTSYEWTESEWHPRIGYRSQKTSQHRVIAFDYGIKRNILRMLAERGCQVTVLPAQSSAADALALNPDGVFLSNGPGDPQACDYAVTTARELIELGMPMFGICLGHQIMALAVGAKTLKMKIGHHGANHPVKDLENGRVVITSQNHGFVVDASTLPANAKVTHISLFDGTLQGFALKHKPMFCFQGHPESSPGPHDISYLFDRFINLMEARKANRSYSASAECITHLR